MPRQRVGIGSTPGAEGARDRRGDPARHPPADIVCISMMRGKTRDTPASAFRSQPAHEGRLRGAHADLDDRDDDGRRGEAEQGGGDGAPPAGPALWWERSLNWRSERGIASTGG